MNSALHQETLEENVRPSICDLTLTWVMHRDIDPKLFHSDVKNSLLVIKGLTAAVPAEGGTASYSF